MGYTGRVGRQLTCSSRGSGNTRLRSYEQADRVGLNRRRGSLHFEDTRCKLVLAFFVQSSFPDRFPLEWAPSPVFVIFPGHI